MAKPDWTKEYISKGTMAFDPDTISIFRGIQQKYGTDYMNFFKSLGSLYKKNAPAQKRIEETIRCIKSISQHVGMLLGSKGRPAKQDEIEDLFTLMDSVEENVKYFREKASVTKALQDRMERVEQDTGITLDKLATTHKMVQERVKKIGPDKKSIVSRLTEMAAPMSGIGSEAMNVLFGPFAAAAKPLLSVGGKAVKSITGAIEKRRRDIAVGKEASLRESLIPMSEYTPERVAEERMKAKMFGPKLGNYSDYERYTKFRGPYAWATTEGRMRFGTATKRSAGEESVFSAVPQSGYRSSVGREPIFSAVPQSGINNVTLSTLKEFFDKTAYHTRYTRELLNAIRGSKTFGGNIEGTKSSIMPIFTTKGITKLITQVVKSLGPVIAASILAAYKGKAMWDEFKKGAAKAKEWGVSSASAGFGALIGGQEKGIYDKGVTQKDLFKNITSVYKTGGMLTPTALMTHMMGGKAVAEGIDAVANVSNKLNRISLDAVPIGVGGWATTDKLSESMRAIGDNIKSMTESIKKSLPSDISVPKVSNDEIFNIKDPILSLISSGSAGVED